MRQIHRAGEKLFIDYAGPTVALADGSRAHIFVAALGASSYTFAYATPRETMADWLGATAQALRFFGGVPQLIVPDNPRALIANPDRYEPRANETVHDLARHYGTSVLPARPYHPQDKGKVESAVQVVERWILMRLRHQKFQTVDDVNEAIAPLLEQLNGKPFQKLPGSRASAFAELDAPALQPLPLQTWELAVYKTVRVHIDQHIEFEGHRYSVPQSLVGQVLEARVTARTVELLHRATPSTDTGLVLGCCLWPNVTAAHGWRRPAWWRWSWAPPIAPMCATSWPMGVIRCSQAPRPNGPAQSTRMCAGRAITNDKYDNKNSKEYTMMMNTTLEQLRGLKLAGMASGLQEQLTQAGMTGISFEERLALLVDREVHWRNDKRQMRLLKDARLKYPQASIEDLDTRAGRGLDRKAVMSLALGGWIESGHSVLITGPTGAGKSWLACALAQYACRRCHSALYQRVPRLGEELRIRHGNGTFGKWLIQLAKTDILLLDDWGMAGIDSQTRADLLEIIDDRAANKATIITSQLPIEHWHAWIGDPTIADAIVDRVLQRNHHFTLTGESLRQKPKSSKKEINPDPS